MSEKLITIEPKHMVATSIIVTPDKSQVVVNYYNNQITHMLEHVVGSNSLQVRVDLVPQIGISLSPEQALALAKSLSDALRENGLWKD